jgi:ketosteroid isomerase-like protein
MPTVAGCADAGVPLGGLHAATPRLSCEAFARALNVGDLDTAVACFAPDACLIAPDATALHGEAPIRALLARLIESRAEIAVELSGVLVVGSLALAHERWTIRAEGEGGSRFAQASQPTLLLREIEGEWKLSFAAPWGWGSIPPLEAV